MPVCIVALIWLGKKTMQNKIRVYKSRRENIRDHIFYDDNQQMEVDRDRQDMVKMLKPCFEYLDKYEVTEYQNLIESFKKIGFRADNIKNFILEFKTFINSICQERKISPIDWIVLRTLKKANFGEKNIILNRLALEYPNELLYFAQRYIQCTYQVYANFDIFFKELQGKIEKIHGVDNEEETKEVINE